VPVRPGVLKTKDIRKIGRTGRRTDPITELKKSVIYRERRKKHAREMSDSDGEFGLLQSKKRCS